MYIVREIIDTIEFDVDEKLDIKFGRTKRMKKRISNIGVAQKHIVQVLKTIIVTNPLVIEYCVRSKMDKYRYRNGKDFSNAHIIKS